MNAIKSAKMFSSGRLSQVLISKFLQNAGSSCGPVRVTHCRNLAISFCPSQCRKLGPAGENNDQAASKGYSVAKETNMRQDVDGKLLTIPNVLTSSRILITPVIGYQIWNGMHSHALLCFSVAALTDLLDGFIARRFNQGSRIGAILDPIADKFLLVACFIALNHAQLMPLWLVGGFIGRDLALMLGGALLRYHSFTMRPPSVRQFLDFSKYPARPEFEPTFVSKCNTALQCLLIVTHLTAHNQTGVQAYDLSISALHALTATTTMVSLAQYTLRASRSEVFGSRGKRKFT